MKYIMNEILAAMNFLYIAWNLAWWYFIVDKYCR